MPRFATVPICSARPSIASIETLAHKFFPGLGNARVVRREKERVQSGGSGPLHFVDAFQPFSRDLGLFLVDSDKVASGPRVRDVELLSVKARVTSAVPNPFELDHDLIPGCGTDVLEDDDQRAVIFDPSHHTAEGATGLSIRGDVLFLVVQIGVVDARSSSHKHIDISGDRYFGTICGSARR